MLCCAAVPHAENRRPTSYTVVPHGINRAWAWTFSHIPVLRVTIHKDCISSLISHWQNTISQLRHVIITTMLKQKGPVERSNENHGILKACTLPGAKRNNICRPCFFLHSWPSSKSARKASRPFFAALHPTFYFILLDSGRQYVKFRSESKVSIQSERGYAGASDQRSRCQWNQFPS